MKLKQLNSTWLYIDQFFLKNLTQISGPKSYKKSLETVLKLEKEALDIKVITVTQFLFLKRCNKLFGVQSKLAVFVV